MMWRVGTKGGDDYLASPKRCQSICGSLRYSVHGRCHRRTQDFGNDRSDINDAATLRHATYSDNGLRHIDGTEDVHGEILLELLLADFHQ